MKHRVSRGMSPARPPTSILSNPSLPLMSIFQIPVAACVTEWANRHGFCNWSPYRSQVRAARRGGPDPLLRFLKMTGVSIGPMNSRIALWLLATAETLFSQSPKRAFLIPRTLRSYILRWAARNVLLLRRVFMEPGTWFVVPSLYCGRRVFGPFHGRSSRYCLAPRSGDRLVGLSGGMGAGLQSDTEIIGSGRYFWRLILPEPHNS